MLAFLDILVFLIVKVRLSIFEFELALLVALQEESSWKWAEVGDAVN